MSTKETLIKELNETLAVAKDLGMTKYAEHLQTQLESYANLTPEEIERQYTSFTQSKKSPLTHSFVNGVKKTVEVSKVLPTRYRYKLRGFDDKYLHIGADNKEGALKVLEKLVELLEGIEKNRLCNFEYVYSHITDIVPARSPNEYRSAAPVVALSLEIRRFKKGEQIIIKLYEASGRSEYVQFDSNYYLINEVVKGFQTAIKRLRKDKP